MTAITLPPLPEPLPPLEWHHYMYTADQLRADRLAVAQAVREACAAECDSQTNVWAQYCAASLRALKIEMNDADR